MLHCKAKYCILVETTRIKRRIAMTQLLTWLKTVFSGSTYGQNLEAYIQSKHPTSVSDVEFWSREYDNRMYSQGL
jgi:hypothetical protein